MHLQMLLPGLRLHLGPSEVTMCSQELRWSCSCGPAVMASDSSASKTSQPRDRRANLTVSSCNMSESMYLGSDGAGKLRGDGAHTCLRVSTRMLRRRTLQVIYLLLKRIKDELFPPMLNSFLFIERVIAHFNQILTKL